MKETFSPSRLVGIVERLSAKPDDSSELRLQKTILMASAVMMSVDGIVWGVISVAFSEPWASAVPFGYFVISLINITAYRLFDRFRTFRFTHILTSMLLPIFFMIALGGFVNSGAVVFWSLVAPVGAVLVTDRREARLWFLAFVGVVVLGGALEPFGREDNDLPSAVINVFFVLNVLAPSSLAIVVLSYFLRQKDTAMSLLSVEREKSDDLLRNVLPTDIATELKENGSVVARRFEAVSVLFADIVGSTQLTVRLAPEELIALLNRIFTQFDHIADRYGAEKIRTIGDNYMAATGVPHPSPSHATDLADMALDMMASVESINSSGSENVQFRIGLNTGPVIAGVVGQRKFHYDIWGDAVNRPAFSDPFERSASTPTSAWPPGCAYLPVRETVNPIVTSRRALMADASPRHSGSGFAEAAWAVPSASPPHCPRFYPSTAPPVADDVRWPKRSATQLETVPGFTRMGVFADRQNYL